MTQVKCFNIYSAYAGEHICTDMHSLEDAMTEITVLVTQRDMHRYFPLSAVLEDDNGRETTVCTVTLGKGVNDARA